MVSEKIPVLDHGHVVLVRSMGDDLAVSHAARVSYAEEWRAGEDEKSDTRLINFLWKHHHTTPFEAVTFTFDIKAPIFVLRQWHRHRTQSYNELSARYRPLPEEYYVPDLEQITPQSKDNKQGREATGFTNIEKAMIAHDIDESCQRAFKVYRDLLDRGVAKELARTVLPVNTYSHMQATMNLLNLMRFLTLRCDAHAQYEIRVYANAMRDLARAIVPVCINAWEKNLPKDL
jgi:thymidylate synthase (FAD)